MTDSQTLILYRPLPRVTAGATAYAPLPIEPFEERALAATTAPNPAPRPTPPPSAPAYPSLPVEPDTRDGGSGGTKR